MTPINWEEHYIRMSEHKTLLDREYVTGIFHGFIAAGILVACVVLERYFS